MEDLIPPRFRDTFSRLFDEVGRILAAYVRGQLLIALCMAVLYAIGFYAFGVPAWAGLAAMAGLLNAIPYVGTILGLGLATAFTLADGGGLWRIGGILGVSTIRARCFALKGDRRSVFKLAAVYLQVYCGIIEAPQRGIEILICKRGTISVPKTAQQDFLQYCMIHCTSVGSIRGALL